MTITEKIRSLKPRDFNFNSAPSPSVKRQLEALLG